MATNNAQPTLYTKLHQARCDAESEALLAATHTFHQWRYHSLKALFSRQLQDILSTMTKEEQKMQALLRQRDATIAQLEHDLHDARAAANAVRPPTPHAPRPPTTTTSIQTTAAQEPTQPHASSQHDPLALPESLLQTHPFVASLVGKCHQLETQLSAAMRELHDTRRLLVLRGNNDNQAEQRTGDNQRTGEQTNVDCQGGPTQQQQNQQQLSLQAQQLEALQSKQQLLRQRVCAMEETLQHAQRACAQYKVDHEVNTMHNDMLRAQLQTAATAINQLNTVIHRQENQQGVLHNAEQQQNAVQPTKKLVKDADKRRMQSLLHFKRKVLLHRLLLAWCSVVVAHKAASNSTMLKQLKEQWAGVEAISAALPMWVQRIGQQRAAERAWLTWRLTAVKQSTNNKHSNTYHNATQCSTTPHGVLYQEQPPNSPASHSLPEQHLQKHNGSTVCMLCGHPPGHTRGGAPYSLVAPNNHAATTRAPWRPPGIAPCEEIPDPPVISPRPGAVQDKKRASDVHHATSTSHTTARIDHDSAAQQQAADAPPTRPAAAVVAALVDAVRGTTKVGKRKVGMTTRDDKRGSNSKGRVRQTNQG